MAFKPSTTYTTVAGSDNDEEHEDHINGTTTNGFNGTDLKGTEMEREDSSYSFSPLVVPEDIPPSTEKKRKQSWKGSSDRFAIRLCDEWYIKYGGLRPPNSPKFIAMIYWVFMVYNILISFSHMLYVADEGECLMVEFLIEAFQIQSLALYYIIYRLIDSDVLSTVTDSINGLEFRQKMRKKEVLAFILSKSDPKPIHLVHNQLLLTALIVIPSYLSGFSVFVVLMDGEWSDSSILDYLSMASNALDFIRYIPLIIHIAIVRSYFHIVQYHLADLCEQFDVDKKYEPGNPSKIEHKELIIRCEELLNPYRTFTGNLQNFVVVHFVFNVVALTLLFFVALEMFGGGHCAHSTSDIGDIANFAHYMIELVCFVALWVFLLMPIIKSHKDMKDKLVGRMLRKAHSNPNEKAVIDSYLRGLTNYSPFEIMGNAPTYGQISQIMYAVAVAVVSGVWAVFQDVNLDCDDEWSEVMSKCGASWDNTTWYNQLCYG